MLVLHVTLVAIVYSTECEIWDDNDENYARDITISEHIVYVP